MIKEIEKENENFYNNHRFDEKIYEDIGKHCAKINMLTELVTKGYDEMFGFEKSLEIIVNI